MLAQTCPKTTLAGVNVDIKTERTPPKSRSSRNCKVQCPTGVSRFGVISAEAGLVSTLTNADVVGWLLCACTGQRRCDRALPSALGSAVDVGRDVDRRGAGVG